MVVTSRRTGPGGPHGNPAGSDHSIRSRRALTSAVSRVAWGITAAAPRRATVAVLREARRRPALCVALAVAGLGAVVVSISAPGAAAPEFRSPPVVAGSTPPVHVSAAAVHSGLAPYAPPAAVDRPLSPSPRAVGPSDQGRLPSPVPPVIDDDAAVLSGVRDLPAEKTPTGAATRTATDPAGTGISAVAASVSLGEPRDGTAVTSTTSVSGTADMPEGYQVWLLSRHGSGSYRVEGACRGERGFTCGPATLESGADETFQLTAVVVDPVTARSLQAGGTRDALPANLAHSEVTVRRAAT